MRKNWLMTPSLYATMLALSGCVTSTTDLGSTPPPKCPKWVEPIPYDSTQDTPETVAAIEAHNSKWEAVCNNNPPAP